MKLPEQDLDHILEWTREEWAWLRGGRLFITGGTGFLGSWILESYLHARDALGLQGDIFVLTRSPEAFRRRLPHLDGHPGLQLVQGDQGSFRFPEGPFRAVIHGAVTYASPERTLVDNLAGLHRSLQFAASAGAERVLFLSSGAVYGPQPLDLVAMDEVYPGSPSPQDPTQAYGEMKRACELLGAALGQCHGFRFLVARCFAFVGPRIPLGQHSAMGALLESALGRQPIRLQGDGSPRRSYLHTADLCVWLWTILSRGQPGRPYNVGSPEGLALSELAAMVRDLLAPGQPLAFAGRPDPGNPRRNLVPNTDRAREELGLQVRIPLEQAIIRTANWITTQASQREPS